MRSPLTLWREMFDRWAEKRQPSGQSITLDQKKIFILPSPAGWGYLLVTLVIFLFAANYQNNLLFAFSFLMVSMFVATILHTYANLAGLTLQALPAKASYASELFHYPVRVSRSDQRVSCALDLGFKSQSLHLLDKVSKDEPFLVELAYADVQRGLFKPPAIKIETVFPLGLLRAWSWVRLNREHIIYPHPIESRTLPDSLGDGDKNAGLQPIQGDEFSGIERFSPGDSPSRILWKAFARGHGLQVKTSKTSESRRLWLSYDAFQGGLERRLSLLCYWAIMLDKQGQVFGLKMPNETIAPNRGEQHLRKILTILAMFGEPSDGER